MRLNLGSGLDIKNGDWINIDENFTEDIIKKYKHNKLIKDNLLHYIIQCEQSSILEVKAYHVLEHVTNLDEVMKELYRICKNGAILDIVVPLANTLWAVANPNHKILFNHRTFQYYCKGFNTSDLGLFQNFEMIEQKIEREDDEWFDGIPWMVANLHVILRIIK